MLVFSLKIFIYIIYLKTIYRPTFLCAFVPVLRATPWHLLGLSGHLTCYLHLDDQPTYTCCHSCAFRSRGSWPYLQDIHIQSPSSTPHTPFPKALLYLSSWNCGIFVLLMRAHAIEVCDKSKQQHPAARTAVLVIPQKALNSSCLAGLSHVLHSLRGVCQARGFRVFMFKQLSSIRLWWLKDNVCSWNYSIQMKETYLFKV